ncbi:outer membrane beta-barrel protein [Pedobacter sp. AW31-3R]|uniref:outer membrane beta-barrel protein n=1 Tax=Pedobacter sp. AW31-3R TaxID=3445781 RepID=UPI003FA0B3E4
MKINITLLVFLVLNLFCQLKTQAQQGHKLSGIVRDTTDMGIPGANVRLITGKDTLISSTDTAGRFSFSAVKSGDISLLVRSIGYISFSKNYTLKNDQLTLPDIVIKSSSQELSEVVIKGKIVPMRVLKDTVEFNADAYVVRENDRVEDLMKQLPGVEIDKDGNATSAGKALTKIRVNGKDFFTGDVKKFISELPADIVSKIQVVDDYGDKANFTGVKKGEPQKILNLVLKPNRNRGSFSGIGASAGTNDRYALNLNKNLWQETKQIGLNGDASNTDTGAGINTNTNVGLNYRNSANKNLVVSGMYAYGFNKNESKNQSYIETTLPKGILFNQSATENAGKSNTHNLMLELQSQNELNFFRGNIRGTLAGTNNNSLLSSIQNYTQEDINRQDINTNSSSRQKNPNLNAEFSMGRKFKREGRNLSAGITLTSGTTDNTENLDNLIRYYDNRDLPLRDSVLNRLVDTRNLSKGLTTNFSFTEPLNNPKDSAAKKSIDFSYQFSLTRTTNALETQANDINGVFGRIDSLSNKYSSTFSTHNIEVNYRYDTEKLDYSIGASAQPNFLSGAYEGRTDKIQRAGFNIAPVARINFKFSAQRMLSLNYNGNSVAPSFDQLQPVNDTRDLQNVIIGNPELKTAFNHLLNLSYRQMDMSSGRTLQLSLRGTAVQDQVVSNTVLIPETIAGTESFRRETRYDNTNGNYGLGGNYFWSIPIEKKKYSIEFKGGMNYNRRVSYADNQKNFNDGLNLSQGLSMRMNQKWMMVSSDVNYNYQSNTSSLAESVSNTVQTWMFNADIKTFIIKSLTAGVVASKTINKGYSVAASNPLLIRGYVEKTFFKNRMASLKIEGNDLLKQGNNLDRVVSDNTITESQTNQITRYFLLSLNVRLQSFGS